VDDGKRGEGIQAGDCEKEVLGLEEGTDGGHAVPLGAFGGQRHSKFTVGKKTMLLTKKRRGGDLEVRKPRRNGVRETGVMLRQSIAGFGPKKKKEGQPVVKRRITSQKGSFAQTGGAKLSDICGGKW